MPKREPGARPELRAEHAEREVGVREEPLEHAGPLGPELARVALRVAQQEGRLAVGKRRPGRQLGVEVLEPARREIVAEQRVRGAADPERMPRAEDVVRQTPAPSAPPCGSRRPASRCARARRRANRRARAALRRRASSRRSRRSPRRTQPQRTTPSGNADSFSTPSPVTRKLSSTRSPPPPSQYTPGSTASTMPSSNVPPPAWCG